MSRLNDPANFKGRVNFAADYISRMRTPSRAFDNCFENDDGRVVAAALYRRAQKNKRLAENMPRYLNMQIVAQDAAAFAHVKTRDLPDAAREEREKARRAFAEFMAAQ